MHALRVVFSPSRAPKSLREEFPEKWGKITKFASPVRPPENGEKLQKKNIFGVIVPLFWGDFPHFRGVGPGEKFSNFSPFFGDFRPRGFPGPLRGKQLVMQAHYLHN